MHKHDERMSTIRWRFTQPIGPPGTCPRSFPQLHLGGLLIISFTSRFRVGLDAAAPSAAGTSPVGNRQPHSHRKEHHHGWTRKAQFRPHPRISQATSPPRRRPGDRRGGRQGVYGSTSALAGSARGVPAWFARLAQEGTPISVDSYQPLALTAEEALTLRAACNRLIPTDELGPGAGDAGAFIYIDRTLAGPGAASLPLYQGGLAALNAAAGAGGFAEVDEATQDTLLTQAEAGELAEAPEGFFELLLEQTRQGMFGDPMYGGNIDFAGWDLIQYPGLKLTWTPEEQAIGTEVVPAHRSVAEQGGVPHGSAS